MAGITATVHFSVPEEHRDEFVPMWKSIDDESPFQFIKVARWESPEALAGAVRATAEARKDVDLDVVLGG